MKESKEGLYLVLLSVHGLLRSEEMELGRDSDTGGQIGYVVELAKTLAADPRVARVDLVTRQIFSQAVDLQYSEPEEQFAEGGYIIRIPFGPKRYLKKEKLWPHLDSMADQLLLHFRKIGLIPDSIHGHYADGGYVGAQLARLLGVPFTFTGHSLGRVKQLQLLQRGKSLEGLEKQFKFRQRIEAEEIALDTAQFVVASTRQEVDEQYKLYDHYEPERMAVIPPGFDLRRFSPPSSPFTLPDYHLELDKFFSQPEKPMILAIARPDEKKNFATLISAFGKSQELREKANLAIIAGNRDDLSELLPSARKVMRNIMYAVDRYDLYGSIAYPKHHDSSDIPNVYRLASHRGGVFVNPALNEPFGLTLLEAAASGLPLVATDDGGPRDILKVCKNGTLIDPRDEKEIQSAILKILSDKELWSEYSQSGIKNVTTHYTWKGHADSYLERIIERKNRNKKDYEPIQMRAGRLTKMDRILVTGIDGILDGEPASFTTLNQTIRSSEVPLGLCFATGRSTQSALEKIELLSLPEPEILITACGTEMYYGRMMIQDRSWDRHIDYKWKPLEISELMSSVKQVELQEEAEQARFKLSYRIKEGQDITRRKVIRLMRQKGLRVNVFFSYQSLIDIVPIRASIGLAIRHLLFKWGLPAERLMVCGFSGLEEQLLKGDTLGVVVGQHSPELKHLRERSRIYFAQSAHVDGLREGIEHYNFLGEIRIPNEVGSEANDHS